MKAENYPPGRLMISQSMNTADASKGHGSGTTGLKRLISQIDAPLPPSKRPCLISLTKADTNVLQNRVHRRVILRDYGKPIYMASSPAALLNALKDCIEGYESLHKAGFLHRDISINNLMINEDKENPSWPSFLIDLDLAIKETRGGGLLAPEEGLVRGLSWPLGSSLTSSIPLCMTSSQSSGCFSGSAFTMMDQIRKGSLKSSTNETTYI
ncbi:hypothetical protein sscle_02g020900 [Sclerotinia sclerotiorum 1980 UF-70]|uniref:non-specific serine/threonine protein kinase n=1 Tax=Sclerotinia sclerotiorum (strain ATCC 18683 / 1980 / Ss-1) TaxID=665079 RepID=A0A1D9PXA6_SCLS1|nr:hypothetical protein sscle_02g020900 [Sclerotinia sclerotiorum 1980 UF-70]